MSAIDEKYAGLGGSSGFLGKPTTNELTCPDGVGHYRHYEHGSIYWHPKTGAHEVHGLILAKWAHLHWERSFLGYPVTDETKTPDGKGRFNHFQGGSIYWHPKTGAHEVHGAIRSKWSYLGWEKSILGYPTTGETKTPDGIGRFNHFQHGSIYWKPSTSAHEVHGLIRKFWANQGWEKNPELGYPISDELPTSPGSKNRYSDFENGVVYWKYGSSQASFLFKFTLFDASKSVDEVLNEIRKVVVPLLTANDRVYIKNGPYLAEVTDYSFDGSQVHNRRYKVRTNLGIDVPVFSDPTANLDLWIEIRYDRPTKTVKAYLTQWWVHVHVPWDTHSIAGVDASDIVDEFRSAIEPELGKPHNIQTITDDKINILSIKVMPNGDLNVYIEPFA